MMTSLRPQPSALLRGFMVLAVLLASTAASADPVPPPPEGSPPPPPAQAAPAPAPAPAYSQQQLDQMLAPVALYPDALLTQILMASTYPLEVVQASRWSAAHPDLKGDEAVKAVSGQNWDPSVKSLVAFPQVLSTMDQKLDWTQQLGNAFLSQQSQVMDTVQSLRQKAMATNNLQSNQQIVVTQPAPQTIVIQQADPDVVYVPYYDPNVVYGPWWWAGYPPYYWAPWPGYYWHPGLFIGFGVGIFVAHGFFYGGCDWGHRSVYVSQVNNYYYHGPGAGFHQGPGGPGGGGFHTPPGTMAWQHDPAHRGGVPYPNTATAQHFAATSGFHVQPGSTRLRSASYNPSAHTGNGFRQGSGGNGFHQNGGNSFRAGNSYGSNGFHDNSGTARSGSNLHANAGGGGGFQHGGNGAGHGGGHPHGGGGRARR